MLSQSDLKWNISGQISTGNVGFIIINGIHDLLCFHVWNISRREIILEIFLFDNIFFVCIWNIVALVV